MQAPTKEAQATCLCGCGLPVAHSFRQGHDQRLKGILMRRYAAGEKEALTEAKKLGPSFVKAVKAGHAKVSTSRKPARKPTTRHRKAA